MLPSSGGQKRTEKTKDGGEKEAEIDIYLVATNSISLFLLPLVLTVNHF